MNISPKNKSLTPFPLIGRGPLFSVAVFTWSPQAKSWHEVIFPSYPMAASHLTDILSGLFSFPQWLWPWFYMCCFSYSWPAHLISHPSITCSKTKKVEEQQTVADSPSLRLRLAKPGPWLLDSSEELVKEARGKEDARGASQLSGRKNTTFRLTHWLTLFCLLFLSSSFPFTFISFSFPSHSPSFSPLSSFPLISRLGKR